MTTRIQIKGNVKLYDMQPQILLAINVAAVHYDNNSTNCVITSMNDSGNSHRVNSLHAIGHAVDLRTKNLPLDSIAKSRFADDIRSDLGPNYDVLLENLGDPNEHLHIEYQPHRAAL